MLSPFSKATSFSSLVLAAGLLLGGCITQHSAVQAGKGKGVASTKGIQDFFVGPGTTQYFLMPVTFKGHEKRTLAVDLTVRDSATTLQWATLRASVRAERNYTPADTLYAFDGTGWQPLGPLKVLFTEPDGKQTLTRIEAPFPTTLLPLFYQNASQGLRLGSVARGKDTFLPGKKTLKRLKSFAIIAAPLGS